MKKQMELPSARSILYRINFVNSLPRITEPGTETDILWQMAENNIHTSRLILMNMILSRRDTLYNPAPPDRNYHRT